MNFLFFNNFYFVAFFFAWLLVAIQMKMNKILGEEATTTTKKGKIEGNIFLISKVFFWEEKI